MTTVADIEGFFAQRYPPAWAEGWDRVGLVVGDPEQPVRRVHFAVDCVPETVAEAADRGADLLVAHHPLLLRGVSSVATVTYKGRIVHRMIRSDLALYVAHTNADVAAPGVSDALAALFDLREVRPLRPSIGPAGERWPAAVATSSAAEGPGRGLGRVGALPRPLTLARLTELAARVLPATRWGVRAAGDPDRVVSTLALCGGSGDSLLADATAAGADAYLTADLRHHPASEHLADGGPALIDAAHWATERPWLDVAATELAAARAVETSVSDLDTDPWTVHHLSELKEPT